MSETNFGPLLIDNHTYHPSHGPKTWPWWRLITINVVLAIGCSRTEYRAWNIWTYTRWGAWCCGWYPNPEKKMRDSLHRLIDRIWP